MVLHRAVQVASSSSYAPCVEALPSSTFSRSTSCRHKVGAHVSAAGGVENAISNAHAIGANAFALFLKSQRKWSSPPLKDSSIEQFKQRLKDYDYSTKYILPHGSYLINLGNPDDEKREKSYECFLDDLRRCELLGLELYNFHPGSTVGNATREESIALIAESINRAHQETQTVRIVIENMVSLFTSRQAQVSSKIRVGLASASIPATSSPRGTIYEPSRTGMSDFDETVGLKYLCGMHLNDSKMPLNSKRDRHANIGLGELGIQAFHSILNDKRVEDIPLILETPSGENPAVWGVEIRTLSALEDVALPDIPKNNIAASAATENKDKKPTKRKTKRKTDT
ncbi:hypothetical protein ONZ45_g596 [Pleurotus djamor]|nr:hypothetical protein ONZ45_g596 [Pleurotus djamor]